MLVVLTGHSPKHMPNARRLRSFRSLALAAEHFDLFPIWIQPHDLTAPAARAVGWSYWHQGGKDDWIQTSSSLGQGVIYDAMYLKELQSQKRLYHRTLQQLREWDFPVFNPILPAKNEIIKILRRDDAVSEQFPKTWQQISKANLVSLFDISQTLWLKPAYGSGGRNLAVIKRLGSDIFEVTLENRQGTFVQECLTRQQLEEFLGRVQQNRMGYMLQQHVNLVQTKDAKTADLRVTVQRDATGAWRVTAVTGRLSYPKSLLTNYHAGGSVVSLSVPENTHMWLDQTGMSEADIERAKLLAIRTAKRLQEVYPLLGLLGIDVGQDVTGSQFVYDCNSRPGRDILTDEEMEQFMFYVAAFARYLSDSPVVSG